jgi:hypothetical protein
MVFDAVEATAAGNSAWVLVHLGDDARADVLIQARDAR